MTIHLPLFDDMKRTDASLRRHNEPFFAYLNRSAHSEATEIRSRLESWFERFPLELNMMFEEDFARMTIMLTEEQFSNYSYMSCSLA